MGFARLETWHLLGILDRKEDPRWREEYELEKRERDLADERMRFFRFQELLHSLRKYGLDFDAARKISSAVWGTDYSPLGQQLARCPALISWREGKIEA